MLSTTDLPLAFSSWTESHHLDVPPDVVASAGLAVDARRAGPRPKPNRTQLTG
jgi:hypothetical protein